jgi:hypothetical protein
MINTFGCNGFGPFLGTNAPNHNVIALNELRSTYVSYKPLPMMAEFKEAVDIGALELPYQFNYTVHIG